MASHWVRSSFNDTHQFKVSGAVIVLPEDTDYEITSGGLYMIQNWAGGSGTNKFFQVSDTEITSTPTTTTSLLWTTNRFFTIYLKAGQHVRATGDDAKMIPLEEVG